MILSNKNDIKFLAAKVITGFAEQNTPPESSKGKDGKGANKDNKDGGTPGSEGSKNKPSDDAGNGDNGGTKEADSGGPDAKGGDDEFAKNGLKAHNMFRKIHEADEMKLDDKMCKEAEEYAKKLADMGTLQHADTDYGENLAMKCSSEKGEEMTGQEATKNW